jgi:hypothetical protein
VGEQKREQAPAELFRQFAQLERQRERIARGSEALSEWGHVRVRNGGHGES